MHWLTPPGTSHPEMYRVTVARQQGARAIPGVRNFGAHIGRALVADEVGRHRLHRELDQRRSQGRLRQDAWPPFRRRSTAIPGSIATCRPISGSAIKEVLTGASESIVVRIFGPELERPARAGGRGASRR